MCPAQSSRCDRSDNSKDAGDLPKAVRLVADAAVLTEIDRYNSSIRREGSGSGVTSGETTLHGRFLHLSDFVVQAGQAYLPHQDPRGRFMSLNYTLEGRTDAPHRMRRFTVTIGAAFSGPGRAAVP